MFQRRWQRLPWLTAVVGLVVGGAIAAQDPLAQLGLTEAKARQLFMVTASWASPEQASEIVQTARRAYQALPREARGPVTTAMYAWVNAFVNSAAFKTEYARHRTASMPQPAQVEGTVDQEIKRRVDQQLKELDEMAQGLTSMPAEQRRNMEAVMKAQRASFTSPEFAAGQREEIQRERAQGKADYDIGMKAWQADFPANQQVWIARQLRAFLDATADVDFTVKLKFYEGLPFTDDPKYKGKWQWAESAHAGREATAAARAAAEAWLKEIGTK